MTRTSISPPIPCVVCGVVVSEGRLRRVRRRGEILCDNCFESNKVQLTFIHEEEGTQYSQTSDVLLMQTVEDVLWIEGLSLDPDATLGSARPLQLLREDSEEPLPGDRTLKELGITGGERLIVRYADRAHS